MKRYKYEAIIRKSQYIDSMKTLRMVKYIMEDKWYKHRKKLLHYKYRNTPDYQKTMQFIFYRRKFLYHKCRIKRKRRCFMK